uniref:Uncharacterized protein n=1 Tax=Pseudomonas sp. 11BF10 TaxID=941394 RepID=E7DYM1_9PSED|nr:hypothetical protein orf6 [Pseudomonas sp. 11BF10]
MLVVALRSRGTSKATTEKPWTRCGTMLAFGGTLRLRPSSWPKLMQKNRMRKRAQVRLKSKTQVRAVVYHRHSLTTHFYWVLQQGAVTTLDPY